MAFPSVRARSSHALTVGGASQTFNLPTGYVAGDLLVIAVTTNADTPPLPPTGWLQLFQNVGGGSGVERSLNVFWRLADGTEGSTVTVPGSSTYLGACIGWAIAGAGTIEGVGGSNATSAAPNPPNLAPSWGIADDTLWLALYAARDNAGPTAAPASYGNANSAVLGSANNTVASAERQLNAASEDPGAFTKSASTVWVSGTVAIRQDKGDFFAFF